MRGAFPAAATLFQGGLKPGAGVRCSPDTIIRLEPERRSARRMSGSLDCPCSPVVSVSRWQGCVPLRANQNTEPAFRRIGWLAFGRTSAELCGANRTACCGSGPMVRAAMNGIQFGEQTSRLVVGRLGRQSVHWAGKERPIRKRCFPPIFLRLSPTVG